MLLKRSGGTEARDPSVIYHEGKFYHCFSAKFEEIHISCADTPSTLVEAKPICAYKAEPGTAYSKELWAPELHVIDGQCYIYVACDDGDNYRHRMYVLANGSSDPTAPYKMMGQLTDSTNKWAIDGTVFTYRGELYTIWSGWEGDVNVCQNLYIAKMSDPLTISSERVMISTPDREWERRDCNGTSHPFINEGPFAYEKDGVLYVLYSGSGSWANHYCIGTLRLVGDDLMNPESWEKYPHASLSQDDGYNGPGHCSVCSDGETDYIAFHTYDEGFTHGWRNVHALIEPFTLENGKIKITRNGQ